MNIHWDTSLLLAAVDTRDAHHGFTRALAARQGIFATSAVAWMEFHGRPVPELLTRSLLAMLSGGVLPFTEEAAILAGNLLQLTGSTRRSHLDSMIAATAILAGAELATVNPGDFDPFTPCGLKILHP